MLNDTERLEPARGRGAGPLLRVVPVDRRGPAAAEGRAATGRPHLRGVPRTADEWTALAKVGSGERDIPPSQCARLVSLGLVLTVSGVPALTRHGRFTLGLAD